MTKQDFWIRCSHLNQHYHSNLRMPCAPSFHHLCPSTIKMYMNNYKRGFPSLPCVSVMPFTNIQLDPGIKCRCKRIEIIAVTCHQETKLINSFYNPRQVMHTSIGRERKAQARAPGNPKVKQKRWTSVVMEGPMQRSLLLSHNSKQGGKRRHHSQVKDAASGVHLL